MNERDELVRELTRYYGDDDIDSPGDPQLDRAYHQALADHLLAAGYRKQPTIDDAMVERAARALCQEKNAFLGEPHCSKTGPWPNGECCEPGCFVEARAALRAAMGEQP